MRMNNVCVRRVHYDSSLYFWLGPPGGIIAQKFSPLNSAAKACWLAPAPRWLWAASNRGGLHDGLLLWHFRGRKLSNLPPSFRCHAAQLAPHHCSPLPLTVCLQPPALCCSLMDEMSKMGWGVALHCGPQRLDPPTLNQELLAPPPPLPPLLFLLLDTWVQTTEAACRTFPSKKKDRKRCKCKKNKLMHIEWQMPSTGQSRKWLTGSLGSKDLQCSVTISLSLNLRVLTRKTCWPRQPVKKNSHGRLRSSVIIKMWTNWQRGKTDHQMCVFAQTHAPGTHSI